jgi:hypothetical protein
MLKYRLTPWQTNPIEPIECVASTSDTVSFYEVRAGHRLLVKNWRKNLNYSYHDTWQSAHSHLLASLNGDINGLKNQLKAKQDRLALAKALKQPAAKP